MQIVWGATRPGRNSPQRKKIITLQAKTKQESRSENVPPTKPAESHEPEPSELPENPEAEPSILAAEASVDVAAKLSAPTASPSLPNRRQWFRWMSGPYKRQSSSLPSASPAPSDLPVAARRTFSGVDNGGSSADHTRGQVARSEREPNAESIRRPASRFGSVSATADHPDSDGGAGERRHPKCQAPHRSFGCFSTPFRNSASTFGRPSRPRPTGDAASRRRTRRNSRRRRSRSASSPLRFRAQAPRGAVPEFSSTGRGG